MFLTKLFLAISNLLIHTCILLDKSTNNLPYEVQRYGTLEYLRDKFGDYMVRLEKDENIHHVDLILGLNLYYDIKDHLDGIYIVPGMELEVFKGARISVASELTSSWGMRIKKVMNINEQVDSVEEIEWVTVLS